MDLALFFKVANSYQYDANGSRTSDNATSYTYDVRGRLVQAGGASYTINSLGQRIAKQFAGQTTVYHYDQGGHLIAESDEQGNFKREYVYLQPSSTSTPSYAMCTATIWAR